jgi:hypothetical protein
VATEEIRHMDRLAPEGILRAALRVVYVAGFTTRNWTYSDEVPRQQIHDLWEAIHDIPSLVLRWQPDAEDLLVMYFDEYDRKWPEPRLRETYEKELHGGVKTRQS